MRRNRLFIGVAATLFLCVASESLAQTPLDQVPAQAPVVIHVRGHERTIGCIKKLAEAALGDLAAQATAGIDSGVSGILAGRELKALSPDASLFIVMTSLPEEDEDPELAVVFKVTNYVQFRDGLLTDTEKKNLKANKNGYEDTTINEKPVFLLSRGEYAIVSFHEKAMKPFVEKKFESIAAKIGTPIRQKFLDNDLSVYVDAKQLNKQYGDKIAQFRQMFEQILQQAEMMSGLGKQMAATKKVYAALFQMVEDSEQFVAGASFEPDGLRLQAHTIVGEKSASNKVFASGESIKLSKLGVLPAGLMSYSSSAGGLELLKAVGMSMFGVGGPAPTDDDDKNTEFSKALSELLALKLEGWFGAIDYPQPGIQIVRYSDNAKAAALSLKLYESIRENASLGGVPLKGKPIIQRDAAKANGFTFHHVQLAWDLAKFVEAFPEELRDVMKESLQKQMGDEMKLWFGTDGKQLLQVNAKDWTAASKIVQDYVEGKATLAKEAAFTSLQKKLPDEGSLLLLLNPAKMALMIAQSAGAALRGLPNAPPIGEPKIPDGPPSYIGLVAASQAKNGTLDVWVSAAAIKTMVEVIKPVIPNLDPQ